MTKILFIRAEWDAEARVWVATPDDVPRLATEAETLEALTVKLESMVPELLDANGYPGGSEVPFELLVLKFSAATSTTSVEELGRGMGCPSCSNPYVRVPSARNVNVRCRYRTIDGAGSPRNRSQLTGFHGSSQQFVDACLPTTAGCAQRLEHVRIDPQRHHRARNRLTRTTAYPLQTGIGGDWLGIRIGECRRRDACVILSRRSNQFRFHSALSPAGWPCAD